ncbi:mCG21504, isoform CRA_a, partial [Mus musculus]
LSSCLWSLLHREAKTSHCSRLYLIKASSTLLGPRSVSVWILVSWFPSRQPQRPRVCSSVTMIYENLQNSRIEEKTQEPGKAAPSQSFLWRILSWTHLLLFSLGLSLLLLVVVSVIGSQNSQLRRDLGTLRATLDNTTSKIKAEFQSLDSRADSFEKGISSLKVDVEDHRQELQAGRDLSQKVTSLESTVEKREQALKTDLSDLTDHVQQLRKDLKALTCQLANLKNNGSEVACCPLHWTEHEGSCYWFSESEKSWPEADKYCRLENSHLVVVNSLE